jgi:hypothetical protein
VEQIIVPDALRPPLEMRRKPSRRVRSSDHTCYICKIVYRTPIGGARLT